MRSKSDDTCPADMYPPQSICGPNIVKLVCIVMEKLTLITKTIRKFKSVDHENEVKVK